MEDQIMKTMTLTEQLKERRPLNNEAPLYRFMYLHEVFIYFEEVRCEALCGSSEDFLIHAEDIKAGGKFEKFANYSLDKIGREFLVSTYLG
jgi:hypothetical protein